jgi:ABC-2 type transport system permease protein
MSRALAALPYRAALRFSRQPSLWLPALAFPLLFSAIMTSALSVTEQLPEFSVRSSYLSYSVAPSLLQGTLLIATACGLERATDIESRFNNRLLLAPSYRPAPTLSHLFCGGALSGALASVLLAVFAVLGVRAPGGVKAEMAIVVINVLFGVGFSALLVTLAGLTRSVQSVMGAYPLCMLLTFFSTALVPADIMAPWFARIATRNPISWVLADTRDLLNGTSNGSFRGALGLSAVLCAGSALLAVLANRPRAA